MNKNDPGRPSVRDVDQLAGYYSRPGWSGRPSRPSISTLRPSQTDQLVQKSMVADDVPGRRRGRDGRQHPQPAGDRNDVDVDDTLDLVPCF